MAGSKIGSVSSSNEINSSPVQHPEDLESGYSHQSIQIVHRYIISIKESCF